MYACGNTDPGHSSNGDSTQYSQEEIAAESKRLNDWFDQNWDEDVARSPVHQSYLGIKDNYDVWGAYGEKHHKKQFERMQKRYEFLKNNFDFNKLDKQTKISYRLWTEGADRQIAAWKYRHHNYPLNQMHGSHSWYPEFMINIHRVNSLEDAEAYIARITALDTVIANMMEGLEIRTQKGIIPPKFVFPYVLDDCNNVITGKPFDDSEEPSPFLADIIQKVNSLEEVDPETKADLLQRAEKALVEKVKPAYESIIEFMTNLETTAKGNNGVWSMPDGGDFYNLSLSNITTTNMTSGEIFEVGNNEIERIHGEMRKIMKEVNFPDDDILEFFDYMEKSEDFYETNDEAGREKYLEKSHAIIDSLRVTLDDLFITKPKAELIVKKVEAFREKSAGKAFYQSPAPDGSRPGTYYVNLYDMTQMPTYQMEALAYHEAIPGHHMQNSIQQELEGIPKFRTLGGGYTAYGEGWGLYSEYIPVEFGFYTDPYSNFGRLAMELWRACRLVVDVGIHVKKWTREEAIEFYANNTPNPHEDCVKMVERHFVMPGQATAYKVGQLKILQLRNMAKEKLGELFDIREFHDVVLTFGAVPLNILEENVNVWIESKKKNGV